MAVRIDITGLQEAQDEMLRAVNALKPRGAFGQAVKFIAAMAHRTEQTLIHVDTGAGRASRHMRISDLEGEVFSVPTAINPRSGQRPSEYLVYEHRRGGSHAFADRTVDCVQPQAGRIAEQILVRAIRGR